MLFRAKVPRKRVFIHIGLPKTGSSALQAFLSLHSERLESLGFSYPFPEAPVTVESGTCSGNLVHVMVTRAKADRFQADTSAIVTRYLTKVIDDAIRAAGTDTVVLSGECIGKNLTPELAAYFKAMSRRHDVTLLAFVRDPYDLTLSGWKQNVKLGRTLELLEETGAARHLGLFNLKTLCRCLAADLDIRLQNYDVIRKGLVETFAKEIGLDLAQLGPSASDIGQKNPSLSYWQARAVVLANRGASSAIAAALVDHFLAHPDRRRDPYLAQIDADLLLHLRDDIALLNQRLPSGQHLRDTPKADHDATDDTFPPDIIEEIQRATSKVAKMQLEQTSHKGHPDLPVDFDATSYLLWNPDVAAAKVDPAQHYLDHGRYEGRRY